MRPLQGNDRGGTTAGSETPLGVDAETPRILESILQRKRQWLPVVGIRYAGLELDIIVEVESFTRIQDVEHGGADAKRRPAIELLRPSQAEINLRLRTGPPVRSASDVVVSVQMRESP